MKQIDAEKLTVPMARDRRSDVPSIITLALQYVACMTTDGWQMRSAIASTVYPDLLTSSYCQLLLLL